MFTNVRVANRVIAVPNSLVHAFVRDVRRKSLAFCAEQSIVREAEIDELVELMDGYTV